MNSRVHRRSSPRETRTSSSLWWCALALSWLLPGPALAYEDQATLGLDLGYVYGSRTDSPHHGAAVGVEASLGLDETWSIRALLLGGHHPGAHARSLLGASAELLYLFDILELVPYLGAGADVFGSWERQRLGFAFGVHPVLGVDWLVSREIALGLVARPTFLLSELAREPFYMSAMLNASLLFDW